MRLLAVAGRGGHDLGDQVVDLGVLVISLGGRFEVDDLDRRNAVAAATTEAEATAVEAKPVSEQWRWQ